MRDAWKRLAQQVMLQVIDDLARIQVNANTGRDEIIPGDSPIEKLLFAALYAHVYYSHSKRMGLLNATVIPVDRLKDLPAARSALIVEPQVQFEFGRVDFVIHAWDGGEWKRLIVECDGHDFHERTQEQAARDRQRDREAQLAGVPVFRFTGTEINRDAWGCAAKIQEWAEYEPPSKAIEAA